jgi:outer membrane protein TolC
MVRIVVLGMLAVTPAFAGERVVQVERVTGVSSLPALAQADRAFGAAGAQAGPDREGAVLTLEQAIALALQKNRQVQNSTLDVAKSKDQIESSKAQQFPQLQLAVTPAYRITPIDLTFEQGAFGTYPPPTGPVPAQNTTLTTDPGYSTAISASVVQPLSQLYKIGLSIEQLGVGSDMSRQDLRNQRQAIVNNVKQAYFAVLQSQSSLEALDEQVVSSRELARVVAEQVAVKAALQPALLQAKASLAQAEYNVGATRHTLASQKEQLNHLLGRDPETPFRVSEVPPPTALQNDPAAAREAALRQRPDLEKARLNIRYADYSISLKRAEYIPDVSLVYKYIAPVTSDVLPQSVSYVGLEVSWDVFDWGKKAHDLGQLQRARHQAQNSADDLASQVVLDVNSSFRKLEDARNFLSVAELNRDAARAQLRVSMDAFRQQTVLLKDLLAAQASLAQANDQYRQAVLGFWEARSSFEKAVGVGD